MDENKGRKNLKLLLLIILLLGFACRHQNENPKKNILFICIDDLRPELNSFGQTYIHSPNIDRLASVGRPFLHHYVNAPSCGPSRYTMLTGRYGPPGNYALFDRAKMLAENSENVLPSMPEWFRQHGYITISVGKISHHPGGLGGPDWNDPNVIEMPNAWDRSLMPVAEWQHPRGAMHGLANGEVRGKPEEMDVFQSADGLDTLYPDGHITNEALNQLEQLSKQKDKPFFLAVGIIKPHLPFGAPKKYLDLYQEVEIPPIAHAEKPEGPSTWHQSSEFMNYNRWGRDPRTDEEFALAVKRHYAACVSYADEQVGRLLDKLKETGADKNTVIVLWGDHGWHLGEHAIWGKHSLFEEALLSPLIISMPDINHPGKGADGVVESVDIFPTLCDLAGLPMPEFVKGISLSPWLANPEMPGHSAFSYSASARTIRTATHRFTIHDNGDIELYDHSTIQKESLNVAEENLKLVEELKLLLAKRDSM